MRLSGLVVMGGPSIGSSLFYCLGLDQVISEASIRFPNVNIFYYLDDGFLFGSADDAREAFDWLDIALSDIGLISRILPNDLC